MEQLKKIVICLTTLLICCWSAIATAQFSQLVGLHSNELTSGHLVIPRRVSPHGEFLTHNLTHQHGQQHQLNNYLDSKQNINNSLDDLHYHLDVNNETLHLELKPHSHFLAPHLIVERHRRDLRTRKQPTAKNTNCHFHGTVRGETESRVALSTCGGLVGHIKTKNNEYYIEPSKHHDAHPTNGHPHVVFHRSSVKQKKNNKQRRRKNHSRKRKKDQEQQQHRYQYQHQHQHRKQQHPHHHHHHHHHAISNCGTKEPRRRTETRLEWQPQGKVKIQGGRKIRRHQQLQHLLQQTQNPVRHKPRTKFKYAIEEEAPVTGTHSKYSKQKQSQRKHHHQQQQQQQPPTESHRHQPTTLSFSSSTQTTRTKRSISSPRHVETLIVADATMVAFHSDVETYLLTIMNMVSALYKDPSIGNAIEVVVVKIILLEEDEAHPDLNLTLNAQKNLDTFCGWQHKLNTANENDPQHHDVAILITRKNICGDNCMTLGLANVGGMCKPKKSCSVNEDNGIMLSHTIAHELGHNFGMFHDTAKIGCHPRVGPIVHIMTPTFGADTLQVCWSNCSRKFITHFLDQGLGDCLDDPPTSLVQYVYPEMPPGVLYNAELQCRLQFNLTEGEVGACSSMNEICSTLWCEVNGECVTNMRPTAPGTNCGKHKWCQNGECVRMEEIVPVDGGWGSWSNWSECSRSCGGGISIQQRECDSPLPANGGVFCIGERKRYKICNKQPCGEGDPSFRAQQCSNYDNVPYQGATYKWQPFFDKNHPCKLFCNDVDDTIIANWGDVVLDGTPCTLGTNNMCIDGICKKVGCDWSIDSDLQEDRCGICGGSGDKCKPVKEVYKEPFNVTEGYVEVVTIPAKARHITIKELGNSPHFLSVAKANSSFFYLNGESLISMPGEFIIAGAESLYDREDEQETISIPHSIEHSIALYTIVRGIEPNEGIYYEFTLPATLGQGRKQNYTWQLSNWTECSASCGGGAQYREPVCYENDRVTHEEELCWSNAQNIRPMKLMRCCNEHQCPAHWWVGPWQFCPVKCIEPGGTLPVKHRSVMCLDQHEIVVQDSVCNNATRPADTEACVKLPDCKKSNKTRNVMLLVQNL